MEAQRTDSHRTLSMILKRQSQLYDLHTHLLGMGNASFWVDHILMNEDILPTNNLFRRNERTRQELCPLVWDKTGDHGFVDGGKVAEYFNYLTTKINVPNGNRPIGDTINEIKRQKFPPVLEELITEKFLDELLDRSLNFGKHFSYDVILRLCDLGKGLGVKDTISENIIQVAVTEKLGIYPPAKIDFREWIIFNAREQKLEIVYGITVEALRNLIKYDGNSSSKANELARAYIINAFSMRNAEGTPARDVDLHNFHGSFTPDFYPRRFALKDSIYSQRLDILAALIAHIVERYQTSLPPVRYCEFSISANDLCRPWVFDVLRSVQFYDETAKVHCQMNEENSTYIAKQELSSFAQLVLYNHFPHLEFAFTGPACENNENVRHTLPHVTYKFLAGFDRRKVNAPQLKDPNEALRFLLEYPQQAILLMIKEIVRSKEEATVVPPNTTNQSMAANNGEQIFSNFLTKLDELKINSQKMPGFYDWVVGLDLFGDELGYPYCPFVARPFIDYIQQRRAIAKENKSKNIFGVRIHCGENVIFADDNTTAYRLFVAHMYIVFRCLRFLQQELEYGIRIGHGIAFDRILGGSMSKGRHRKSSVLLAEIREHAKHLMKTIAFEVNITSNEYLLGQTLRQGDNQQPLRLDGLFGKIPIILATDDDGVWPIDQCAYTHPGHQSLVAEYCRAISSGLIKEADQLNSVLQATKNFCFWNTGGKMPITADRYALPADDTLINTVIIHPDLIRRLLKLYGGKTIEIDPGFQRFVIKTEYINLVEWENEYGALRVAFVCICANHGKNNETQEKEKRKKIRQDYKTLFDGTAAEFNTIYNFWREVRSELIFSNAIAETTPTPECGRHVVVEQEGQNANIVYCSPEPDNSETSQYKPLTDFLHQFRLFGYTIHAYGNNVNIEKTINVIQQAINSAGSDQAYQNMTLYLYTNTNVYTYVPSKFGNKFTFKINPHSSKRDTKKESFLYAVCPRASAATAALHLICDKIQLKASQKNSHVLLLYKQFGDSIQWMSSRAPREITMELLELDNGLDGLDQQIW